MIAPTHPLHRLRRWILVAGLIVQGSVAGATGEPSPHERIDFWQRNYTAVTPKNDLRVARAQDIFRRLVRVAGRRPGVEPRLHVILEDPAQSSLPIAIPDGWVVISRRVIDFCYRVPQRGKDRLAFVLAHEIAHHMENDFWHVKFFQALETYQQGSGNRKLLGEVREIAALTNKVLAKELRADELGITYLAMAGFDPRAVLGDDSALDFFREWISMLDPGRLGARKARTHPEPSQRVITVRARLRQVADQTELFHLGLMFFRAGDYARAAWAFDEFRRYFPGREVHHNLGAAHHQHALRLWRPLATRRNEPLFKLSVAIDPLTRAFRNTRGSNNSATQQFEEHIAAAIEQYEVAINQDPDYLLAYRNLGSAHIIRGDPYKAIAVLQDALKIAPGDAAVLNNLGVAFYHAKNPAEAHDYLVKARAADSSFDAPLFNLAILAHQRGDANEASRYWREYLESDPTSDWASIARDRYGARTDSAPRAAVTPSVTESLAGLEIGAYENEIPKSWGRPVSRVFHLESARARVAIYPNGLKTVSLGDEIRIITATPSYKGTTRRGVHIGQTRQDVERQYGAPSMVVTTTTGEDLMYLNHGVTFSLQENRVASWLLYWD